ncbi:MAG: flavin reductase family protein [Dehalococcoidales bacterium]|nr:flavin reductase family protein [Dehalococcoidales bacterium]
MKIDPATMERSDAHNLLVSCVVPRPIAFVSTIGKDGVFDVAPYSSFAMLAVKPMLVGFTTARRRGSGDKKRTLVNIESSKEFVLNLVTESMAKAMNQASAFYPADSDKFKAVGLTPVKADRVKPPMVAESPINMECRVVNILEFGEFPTLTTLIIGQVVMVHARDEVCQDGVIQMSRFKAVGRMGGQLYCRASDIFEMRRPD